MKQIIQTFMEDENPTLSHMISNLQWVYIISFQFFPWINQHCT